MLTISGYEDIPTGSRGEVLSRWFGTVYAVELDDGSLHWMDGGELDLIHPTRHHILPGDLVVVRSNKHKHDFVNLGDIVKVVKIIQDADYYETNFQNRIYWIPGFHLAADIC